MVYFWMTANTALDLEEHTAVEGSKSFTTLSCIDNCLESRFLGESLMVGDSCHEFICYRCEPLIFKENSL